MDKLELLLIIMFSCHRITLTVLLQRLILIIYMKLMIITICEYIIVITDNVYYEINLFVKIIIIIIIIFL